MLLLPKYIKLISGVFSYMRLQVFRKLMKDLRWHNFYCAVEIHLEASLHVFVDLSGLFAPKQGCTTCYWLVARTGHILLLPLMGLSWEGTLRPEIWTGAWCSSHSWCFVFGKYVGYICEQQNLCTDQTEDQTYSWSVCSSVWQNLFRWLCVPPANPVGT
jgi:hypothetical protein